MFLFQIVIQHSKRAQHFLVSSLYIIVMHTITKEHIVIPSRNPNTKKGDSGRVLVVGGSKDYVGALTLAGLSALRAGCDWVTIACPEKVAWAINAFSADLVTKKLSGEYLSTKNSQEVIELAKSHNVILMGNGAGLREETVKFFEQVNAKTNFPNLLKVIDADAIKSLSAQELSNSIITPHKKELEIFLLNSNIDEKIVRRVVNEEYVERRAGMLQSLLKGFLAKNNVILVKGRIDTIITSSKIIYNKTGNPGMAKAGTGDVLAGLCAGFLAQNNDLLQSAINGAYFNGLIGDILLEKKKGYCYIASDMVGEIQGVLKRFSKKKGIF